MLSPPTLNCMMVDEIVTGKKWLCNSPTSYEGKVVPNDIDCSVIIEIQTPTHANRLCTNVEYGFSLSMSCLMFSCTK
jgi:hypothetical protein